MTHPFTVSHDSRHLILVEQFVGHILQHGHDLWAGDGAVLPHTSTSLSGELNRLIMGRPLALPEDTSAGVSLRALMTAVLI